MTSNGVSYDGVPSSRESGIFGGKSFFIHRQCPSRTGLVAKVKAHGGEVVGLEKNADFLIHDHARRHVPPLFLSWRFIDECLKFGKLVSPEEHLINPGNGPQPGSSTQPIKSTRRPFTAAEDKELKDFVIASIRRGAADGGNDIYKKYAESHTTHTWQSWRDRWRKKLQPLLTAAEKRLMSEIGTLPPDKDPDFDVGFASPVSDSFLGSLPPPKEPQKEKIKSGNRTEFNDEDDNIIVDFVTKHQKDKYSFNGTKIWKELAMEFPHHTSQSWRNRYLKHVEPRIRNGALLVTTEPPHESKNSSLRQSTRADSSSSQCAEADSKIEYELNKMGDDAPLHYVEHELPSSHADVPGDFDVEDNQLGIDKEEFWDFFRQYRQRKGLPVEHTREFGEKNVNAWDFFNVAMGKSNQSWESICSKIGIDVSCYPEAPGALEKWYDEDFAEFVGLLASFIVTDLDDNSTNSADRNSDDEPGATDHDEGEESRTRLLHTEDQDGPVGSQSPNKSPEANMDGHNYNISQGTVPISHTSPIPSSPPQLPLLKKRKLDASSESYYPFLSGKKQSIVHDRITFATPSCRSGNSRPRSRSPEGSPSREIAAAQKEPETQDFAFNTQAIATTKFSAQETPSRRMQHKTKLPFHSSPHTRILNEVPTAYSPPISEEPPVAKRQKLRATFPLDASKKSVSISAQGEQSAKCDKPRTPDPKISLHAAKSALQSTLDTENSQSCGRQRIENRSDRTKQYLSDPNDSGLSNNNRDPIEIVIDGFVSQGYSKSIAVEALQSASYEPLLAHAALESLLKNGEIPDGIAGLWTAQDDEDLKIAYQLNSDQESVDETRLRVIKKKLRKKHGREHVRERRQLWKRWNSGR